MRNTPLLEESRIASLRELNDDKSIELVNKILSVFLEYTKKQMQDLEVSVSSLDYNKTQTISHSLKSSCGNIGALKMMEFCIELESAAKASNGSVLSLLYNDLNKTYQQTLPLVEEIICDKDTVKAA